MGRLIFTLSNSYGELYRKYLTVTQNATFPRRSAPSANWSSTFWAAAT